MESVGVGLETTWVGYIGPHRVLVDYQQGSVRAVPPFTDPLLYRRLGLCRSAQDVHVEVAALEHFFPTRYQPSVDSVRRILSNLQEVDFRAVHAISKDFSKISLKFTDSASRTHEAILNVEREQLSIQADIPASCLQRITSNQVSEAILELEREVEFLQDFWVEMDLIDDRCLVLEPVGSPARACTERRIAIDRRCSISLSVSPENPRAFCPISFFGPEEIIASLKQKLHLSFQTWDTCQSVITNLSKILQIEFPPPNQDQSSDVDQEDMDCSICFCFDLDGSNPDFVCSNSKCGKLFHKSCIREWLKSLSSSKISFGTVYGTCPNCSSSLTIES